MFSFRYCTCCLKRYAAHIENATASEYLVLKIPVEDEWGFLFTAHLAILAEDFWSMLDGDDRTVDLADHATLLRVEDYRRSHQSSHFTTTPATSTTTTPLSLELH